MKTQTAFSLISALLLGAVVALNTPARAQQPPTPGPEHEILKKMEGNWTAKVVMGEDKSDATATYKMELGGLWLLSNFSGELGGLKFQGHGMDGWDPAKGKYVSVWIDSMSSTPLLLEGTYDRARKTMTMFGEGPGPDGIKVKHKAVTQFMDADHHTFTMFMVTAEGAETKMVTVEYTRKK